MFNQEAKTLQSGDSAPMQKAKYRAFRVWGLIGIIAIVAGAFWVLGQFDSAVILIFLIALFSFMGAGIVRFLERHGVSRGWGSILAILFYIVVVGIIIVAFIPFITEQISALISEVPNYVSEAASWIQGLQTSYPEFFQNTNVIEAINRIGETLSAKASSLAAAGASGIVSFGVSVGSTLVTLFMALVASFWIMKDLPKLHHEALIIVGPKYEVDYCVVTKIMSRVAGGYLKGLLINSTCTGIIAWLGFMIIGVPYSGVLGLLTGILNIIPIVGPWIGGAIAALVAVFVSPLTAILSIVVTVIAQQATDSFISPRVMSSTVEIHPALVIIALTAGGCVGGIIGMVVAVPLTAVIKALYVYYFEKRTGRSLVSEDGAFFQGVPSDISHAADAASGSTQSADQGLDEGVTQRFKRVSSERSEIAKSRRKTKKETNPDSAQEVAEVTNSEDKVESIKQK